MTPETQAALAQMPRPSFTGVIPYLQVRDVRAAAALYERAFGAETRALIPMGDKIAHCYVHLNQGPLFLGEPFPEHGAPYEAPQGYTLHLQVDDADAWFDRAVKAGLEVVCPVKLEFWGDRYGQVRDPFGVCWSIGGPAK